MSLIEPLVRPTHTFAAGDKARIRPGGPVGLRGVAVTVMQVLSDRGGDQRLVVKLPDGTLRSAWASDLDLPAEPAPSSAA